VRLFVLTHRRLGIAGKFLLSSVCIFVGLGVALTWYSVSQLRSLMYEQIVRRVEAQALNWIAANRNVIELTGDPRTVSRLTADLQGRPGIAYVLLLDPQRRTIAAAGARAGLSEMGIARPVAGVSSRLKRTRDAAGERYFEVETAISSGTGMNPELESLFSIVAPAAPTGVLRVGIDEREIGRSLTGLVPQNVIQFAALLLLALAVNIILARRMAVPIAQMARVSTEIAAGNLETEVRAGAGRNDEIGDLVRDFNQMSKRLAENRREMDLLYTGLEEKVRERTLALEQANQRLQELDELKSQFLTTVSHELRSPLMSINWFAQILLDSRPDEATTRRFLSNIDKESDRLSRLTSDLLDLAKIESNLMIWRKDSGDLRDVVSKALASLDALREAKSIGLESSPHGCYRIRADLDRIQQVVTNVVGNAIKFTPAGGRIAVRLDRQLTSGPIRAASGDYAVVIVSDTGPGVPVEERELIFSKFYQGAPNQSAKSGKGFGLGLAISKEIVLQHKGEIWVESDERRAGSTFCFTLPLFNEPEDRTEAASAEGRN
jgi:signal transduction histidine kinase